MSKKEKSVDPQADALLKNNQKANQVSVATLAKQQDDLQKQQDSLAKRILKDTQSQLQPMPKESTEIKEVDEEHISDKAKSILKNLDAHNSKSLDYFGVGVNRQNTQAAIKVLDSVQTKQTDLVGKELVNLSVALKNKPDGYKKQNWLMNLFHKVKLSTLELQAEYQKAGTVINAVSEELQKKTDVLQANNQDMKLMYHNQIDYFHALTDYIEAGEVKSKHLLENDIPQAKMAMENAIGQEKFDAEQTYQGLINYQNRLSKLTYDLRTAQTLAYQQIQQLNIIASSNIKLIDTIHTSISMAIPIWYQQATMSLFLRNQKNANDANEKVVEATKIMLQNNSKQMAEQSTKIVKNSESAVISADTLETNYNNILTAVKSCQEIIDNSNKQRDESKKKLLEMNNEFHKQIGLALTSSKADNMLTSLDDTKNEKW